MNNRFAEAGPRKMTKKAIHRRKLKAVFYAMAGILLILISVILLLPQQQTAETEAPVFSLPVFSFKPQIAPGTKIAGVDVGGMTEERAVEVLNGSLSNQCEVKKMVLTYGGKRLALSPELTQAHWEIKEAVEQAMTGSQTEYAVNFFLDKELVREQLREFFADFGGIYSPSGFWLEGEMPDLNEGTQPCQTLVLNPGCTGLYLDLEDILDRIMDAYRNDEFRIALQDAGEVKKPTGLDLEEISRQVGIAPVNPSLNRKTLEILPGKVGYGFDMDAASKMLENAVPGESIRIPMGYMEPTLPLEEVWYQDTLGYCKTEHTDNENRNQNLGLACSKLNGIVLQPGETLSYNMTLGERTSAAGYKPAPAYSGVDLVDEIGGGICQVSSTLYLSALFADMTIVERRNHGFPVSYIPLGLDATVNWGTTDLKIRNDHDLPVKILAEVSDGYVKIRIMGVDQRDDYVKMEYRVDDHPSYAAAYKCRYDKETDEELSRVLDHTSIYLEEVWCWPGYAQSATDEA